MVVHLHGCTMSILIPAPIFSHMHANALRKPPTTTERVSLVSICTDVEVLSLSLIVHTSLCMLFSLSYFNRIKRSSSEATYDEREGESSLERHACKADLLNGLERSALVTLLTFASRASIDAHSRKKTVLIVVHSADSIVKVSLCLPHWEASNLFRIGPSRFASASVRHFCSPCLYYLNDLRLRKWPFKKQKTKKKEKKSAAVQSTLVFSRAFTLKVVQTSSVAFARRSIPNSTG